MAKQYDKIKWSYYTLIKLDVFFSSNAIISLGHKCLNYNKRILDGHYLNEIITSNQTSLNEELANPFVLYIVWFYRIQDTSRFSIFNCPGLSLVNCIVVIRHQFDTLWPSGAVSH